MGKGILVHEWLARVGGSEKAFDAMVESFPDADLLCLWSDVDERYPGRNLRETWLAQTPLRRNKALAVPVIPATWRGRRPSGYDWALVSSHMFAHHVSFRRQPEGFRKFVYVYSPARYLWNPDLDARGGGALARAAAPPLRALDRKRASEPYAIAAISDYVRERVARTWQREATVIYPPVDVPRIQAIGSWASTLDERDSAVIDSLPRPFVLGASRFIPYKRLDLVIAAGEAVGLPVVLAGAGPEEASLRARAVNSSVPVHFVQDPGDALLYALYEAALVFVFPAVEDFGIMPVEAMAVGTPVLSLDVGGAAETVVAGSTGAHVRDWSSRSELVDAITLATGVDPENCRAQARNFSRERFMSEIRAWVGEGAL